MEKYRKEMERDRIELASKVNVLAQEVNIFDLSPFSSINYWLSFIIHQLLFERRLGVAQLVGLFILFVFVGLTRGSTTIPLNMVSNQVLRRRTSSKDESDSDFNSRDTSLHAFRHKIDRSDSTGSIESKFAFFPYILLSFLN